MADRYLDPEWDDSDLPQAAELADLAAHGERAAVPLAPSAVRRLGTRRRQRRHALIGTGALAVVVLAGGIAVGNPVRLLDGPPPVAATPSPRPSGGTTAAARTVTEANLLATEQVPVISRAERTSIAGDGVGRSADTSSACIPDGGLAALGATSMVTRNFLVEPTNPEFTPDPSNPMTGQPSYYTQALQFPDQAAATRAVRTYERWMADCPTLLRSRNYTLLGTTVGAVTRTQVEPQAVDSTGEYFSLTYREPADQSAEGYFENVGLTQRVDRVMVTVRVHYSQDDNGYVDEEGGDPSLPAEENPEFGLIRAAALKLGD